jgi:hypothetical protein
MINAFALALSIAALLAHTAPARAQAQPPEPANSPPMATPVRLLTSFEQVTLPQGERMGLVAGTLLWPMGEGLWWGPSVYGAATGHRGGLFVLGAELQRRWTLGPHWALDAGLYAGGGGGANAPVGGGLMLRGATTLSYTTGPARLGVSLAQVRFSGGGIRSNQLGTMLEWSDTYIHYPVADAGRAYRAAQPSGMKFDRIAATTGHYALQGAQARNIGLVGARAERLQVQGGAWGLEAAAAAQGDAAGYMELWGDHSRRWWPAPQAVPALALHARLALGLGGGGAVPVDGGVLAKATAGAQWTFGSGWAVGADWGQVRGLNGPLRAQVTQLWLAAALEPLPQAMGAAGTISANDASAALQRVSHAARKAGQRAPLDTMGLKLDRYLTPHLYLSGQAHSAFAGGAGAYSIGLFGAGLATAHSERWRTGAEALVGAAGGGGVASGGGAIAQAVWWISPPAGSREAARLRLGAGAVRSLRGGTLNSPVLELSWSKPLGLGGR